MSKVTVRFIKNWDFPDWRCLSPNQACMWDDVIFTEDPIEHPDYVVILNQPAETVQVNVAPNKIWAIIQEPPTKFHRYLHQGQKEFSRIYTSDENLAKGNQSRYIGNYPVTVWHVKKSFDQLIKMPEIPEKKKDLSWITSNLSFLPLHKKRLTLVKKIGKSSFINIYGRGYQFIEDKWDALAPYRYSIVFENFINSYYWSEKIIDCYLSGTMPVYIGCTNISKYFPKSSFIPFDPSLPDPISRLQEIIQSSKAEDNRKALIEARRRCLYEYQLFPFSAGEIAKDRSEAMPSQKINLYPRKLRHPLYWSQAIWHWKVLPALTKLISR